MLIKVSKIWIPTWDMHNFESKVHYTDLLDFLEVHVLFDKNVRNYLLQTYYISLLRFHFPVIYFFRDVAVPARSSPLINQVCNISLLFPTSGRKLMLHKDWRSKYRILGG
jgi:hypothetical protein